MQSAKTVNAGISGVSRLPWVPSFWQGRVRSIWCAMRGIVTMLARERNAWVHLVATAVVALGGIHCQLSTAEWCWIVLAITVVWIAEALNTALEYLTDLVCPVHHPLARKAKDVAAGGVLIAAAGAALIGLLIFAPHISPR